MLGQNFIQPGQHDVPFAAFYRLGQGAKHICLRGPSLKVGGVCMESGFIRRPQKKGCVGVFNERQPVQFHEAGQVERLRAAGPGGRKTQVACSHLWWL